MKPFQLFLAFSLVFFLLFSCNKGSKQSPQEELKSLQELVKTSNTRIEELQKQLNASDTSQVKSKRIKKVVLDTLRESEFQHYVEALGMVDAENTVVASPQMNGIVKSIRVKEGDRVSSGQILATLDAKPIMNGIEEVRNALSLANTMYEKQKSLWQQNIGSEAQYLAAKNQKEQLENKIITLQSQLALANVVAPVSGEVDEIKLRIGEIAAPGMNGIRVVNNSKLRVKAKLSDMYANKVKKGDKVLVHFPDLNKEISSTVSFASNAVNLQSRTILVEVALPSSKEFKTNQAARIKINDSKIKNALVVSSNIIQKSINGDDYVLVAESENNQWVAKKKVVTISKEYNGLTVIQSGLKKGDLIISAGYGELVDGQQIQL